MKRKISEKLGRRCKIWLVLIIASMFIGVASASLLTYYGRVDTTANVLQSVVVSEDGTNWNNYDDTITTEIENMVSCTPYIFKYWIWNRACAEAGIDIVDSWLAYPGGSSDGYIKNHYVIGDYQTIELRQKDVVFGSSEWDVINENDIGADLTIKNCRTGFWYELDYYGIPDNEYCLIYYGNMPDYWEAGPVTVIDTFTISGDGIRDTTVSGIQSMPFVDDENAITGIALEEPSYDHKFGAKFWIVPSSIVDNGDINWGMGYQYYENNFLWETDLGLFENCGFAPTNIPLVYDAFSTSILQPETIYCWINYNYVPTDITPGTYMYRADIEPVV